MSEPAAQFIADSRLNDPPVSVPGSVPGIVDRASGVQDAIMLSVVTSWSEGVELPLQIIDIVSDSDIR